jgi:hypothetical protein
MLECRPRVTAVSGLMPADFPLQIDDHACTIAARTAPRIVLNAPGFMNLKPLLTLCLCLLPGVVVAGDKTVYGLNEYAELTDIDLQVAAKLDTGAKTASLSARDIKHFKRDGESWVRFYLAIDDAHAHPIERPLARLSKIKRRADDRDADDEKKYTARPVISLNVCMGGALRTIEVNLTDRSAFQYPLLIGSEALKRFDALVDPSLKYAAGKPACAITAQITE